MASKPDPEAERIELALIANDVTDACRILAEPGGLSSIIAFPLAGFVAEESLAYFDSRNRHQRIGSLLGTRMDEFRRSAKKVRARIKLFDDTDTGQQALDSFMGMVRTHSRTLFAHRTSRVLQFLSAPFRPDLGAFFAGEALVGTSHTALPAMGVTPEFLMDLRPGTFENFSKVAFDFGEAMGQHLAKLGEVLETHGLSVTLRHEAIAGPPPITYNDFVGDKFYRRAEIAMADAKPNLVPGLTLCLAQTNACLAVFPKILPEGSNLLLRVQFLTAYHGSNALRRCLKSLPEWLPLEPGSGQGFELPGLRNLLAHYELRAAAAGAMGSEQPLLAAIAGLTARDPGSIREEVLIRLQRVSGFLSDGLNKEQLRPVRALLGEHS